MIVLFSCQNNTSTADTSVTELINAEDFKAKLEQLDNEQLIDLRTPDEVNEGFIPNALFIDFYDKNTFETKIQALDKSKPVMVYCASGNRSGKSVKILKKQGFEYLVDLDGGFGAWSAASYPTDKP